MKLKNIASGIGILLMFVMSIAGAIAQPSPMPIVFTVQLNGHNVDFEDTKVTNKETGEVLTVDKISQLEITNGIGGFDLSQFEKGFTGAVPRFNYLGDEIEAKVCDFHQDCTIKFYAPSEANYHVPDFKFSVRVDDSDKYVCWDRSVVTDLDDCPLQPEPETPDPEVIEKIVCVDGTEVTDAEDCVTEEEDEEISGLWKALIALAIIILGTFSWGKGFTGLAKYYFNKGKELEAQGRKKEAKAMYERASKMLKTALTKAKEGAYKK